MKRFLIFFLFISLSLTLDLKTKASEIYDRSILKANITCKGGKLMNEVCKCPNGKKLINGECKIEVIKCKGGKLELGKCICPDGNLLYKGECLNRTTCPPRSIKIGNICFRCGKNEIARRNECIRIGGATYFPGCRTCKKPVIYLYPEKSMDISVQLNFKNIKFTTIYPKFNGKYTWNVHAKPNGDILIKDKTYPYLFWEADSYNEQEQNEGFLVTNENAEQFLEEKLKILGLNEKEKTDFITFWLPVLLKNKLSLCTFQTQKFFENFELNISPKPDSLIRVFLTIKKLDNPINIKEQNLKSIERKGFTVIEWGGSNF